MKKVFTLISFSILVSHSFASQIYNGDFKTCSSELSQTWTETHPAAADMTQHTDNAALTTSAIDNVAEVNEVKVYPNPASSKINFNLSDNMMGGIIRIYNILGSELITLEIGNNLESIDICPLEDGIHVYRILDKNNKLVKTGKFNKEK